MRVLPLLVTGFLCSCNASMYIDTNPGVNGTPLATGEARVFRFFTSDPAFEPGVSLTANATYSLEFPIVSNWIDGEIDTDESGQALGVQGFANSVMPIDSMSLLKRSGSHRWFEVMLYQDGCRRDSLVGLSDLSFDPAGNAYLYRAPCSGDLKLFVNDSQGFYINNSGFASVRITRTD